jgi:hypothetical protein
MFKRFRNWFRQSSHLHIREASVHDVRACVELLDRFLDGSLRYPLEWDDFISWEHENLHVEATRKAVAQTEPLFLSGDLAQRSQAIDIVVHQRDGLARLAGVPGRGGKRANDAA